ncbi:Oidioi.mRNA.OKI2018_I69.chr2.g6372.t1.cds [Oikopleura dioica]|uniref:ubiquitinyl hydrolase 1 n=1 Tax=Oikopleura dioica TaxID=34765 RepID=A0ABN7T9B6_OIKDI|nr:Oidioi.mRNA.OKI2018_I69.chr2.g6372.t1.cds [Oikopleura dioica]
MTIAPTPNKKLKASGSKEGERDRKRPRHIPSTSHDPSIRTKNARNQIGPQSKKKQKVRRDPPPRSDSKLGQCDPSVPLSPCLSPRMSPLSSNSQTSRVASQPEQSGYNSEDEYDRAAEYSEEREKNFRKVLLEERGFEIIDVQADGACMFRSVADQIYGDESMHDVIRHRCCDYMALNADYFRNWVTENFEDYISRKRLLHTHGNHIELQAMSELYLRKFEIFEYSPIANQTFDCSEPSHYTPIRLSYHNGNHYNSIRNPLQATIGAGLGIPGMSEHASLLSQALNQSELDDTEKRMLLDKANMTDYQATDQELLAQVARDSLEEFYNVRNQNKKQKKNQTKSLNRLSPSTSRLSTPPPPISPSSQPSSSSSSSLPSPEKAASKEDIEQKPSSSASSPNAQMAIRQSRVSLSIDEPGPSSRQDPVEWGVSDWVSENDEESIMAAILQQSAQEFYSSSKE